MANPESVLLPAIEALEKDLSDLERQANGLLTSINLLRGKAGLPPRPGGWSAASEAGGVAAGGAAPLQIHSDTFTGKKLGSAVRQYLEMRAASGIDRPATSREIFEALKEGGFTSGAKDDATALVVLRTMLRKNTTTFAKLRNGKFGLRAWYPTLKVSKDGSSANKGDDEQDDSDIDAEADNADAA